MHFFWNVRAILVGLFIVGGLGAPSGAANGQEAVEIRVVGRYYMGPANVQIDVTLVPHAENRVLRIEADGENFFRSTEIPLEGDRAPKFHTVRFRSLPSGHYLIRAQVFSNTDMLAVAQATLDVM